MLWALHPLVTETVIYATQRSEQMMAFFYLATLYCSVRYWTGSQLPFGNGVGEGIPHRTKNGPRIVWLLLAVLACLAGMGSKEVMVSAPLMVLLYERTFIAGSLRNALRRSWPLYIGLALTWILLLFVSLRAPYGTAAGFGVGVPTQHYWLTQAKVFLVYLKLCFWPSPLLIHYELPYLTTFTESWMFVLPVFVLGLITLVLLWRNHPAGYLGTAVFAILAPTSLIPIRLEMAAERRMYLPLEAVVILTIIGGYWLVQTARAKFKSNRNSAPARSSWAAASALFVVLLGLIFCAASIKRLATYSSEMALWKEVLQHQPNNIVAHNNIGLILTNAGRLQEAIEELQATLAIKPDYTYGLNNLGNALSAANRLPEAIQTLESAVRIDSGYFQARNNLGVALVRSGRPLEAIEQLQQARRLEPNNNEARVNLGNALLSAGRVDDSIREYEAVLAADPNHVLALINLSISLARAGRVSEAIERVEQALRLQPENSDAHTNLGTYLSKTGKAPQAMEQFRLAIERNPDDFNAHLNYGNLLVAAGRAKQAIAHFQRAVQLQPNSADAYSSLGAALQKVGQPQEAVEPYRAALRLAPMVPSYANLAQAYRLANRPKEAIATAQQAIDLAGSNKHPETVAQIQEWLKQYQAELERKGDAVAH
jgi:tetratricopeptide (TPR) repeat protein